MFKNHWYLICPANELKQEIITRTILGEKILLYRNPDASLSALEDRCCHRNVRLSLGYLKQDHIVCGYHGWEYNKEGVCMHIPSQMDEAKIPKTARIRNYPVIEHNKWVWVFMGEPSLAQKIQPVEIPEMNEWPFTYNSYTFEADLESTAESLIDPYHIAFTHRNSIKSFMGQIEEFPADFNLNFVEDGIEGTYNRANKGSAAEKMYFGTDNKLHTGYRFYHPNISRLQIDFKERTLLILEHVMAVDDTHVNMMQITLWKNIFAKFPFFARHFMAKKSAKIVKEDIALLTSQIELLKESKNKIHEVSVIGDEISLAFRKFWRRKMNEETANINAG